MTAQQSIDELVRMLRARARRYKTLAESLYDRQTAAKVASFADELEAQAARLETPRWPHVARRVRVPTR